MPGDGLEPGQHDTTTTRWPWDSPFAWAFPPPRRPRRRRTDRQRGRPRLLAAVLARIRRPSGSHHADPGEPPPPCPAPPPRDDGCSPGAPTLLEFTPIPRVPPYVGDLR